MDQYLQRLPCQELPKVDCQIFLPLGVDAGTGTDGRHLERGVIAELLQPGAPLEFFSQKA